jgi:Helix-turn-helix domain
MRKVKTISSKTDRKKLELVELETLAEILQKVPISERTLHRYLNDGKIRAYKLDGKIVFNPADVAAFLDRRSTGGGPKAPLLKEKIFEELSKPKFLEFEWRGSYHIMTEAQAKQFFAQKLGIPEGAWLDVDEDPEDAEAMGRFPEDENG